MTRGNSVTDKPTTIIRWKDKKTYLKVLDFSQSKGYGINDFCQSGAVEKMEKMKNKKKTKSSNFYFYLYLFLVFVVWVIGMTFLINTSKTKSGYEFSSLQFIKDCGTLGGNIESLDEKLSCEMANQTKNRIKLEILCKQHKLKYTEENILKCS